LCHVLIRIVPVLAGQEEDTAEPTDMCKRTARKAVARVEECQRVKTRKVIAQDGEDTAGLTGTQGL